MGNGKKKKNEPFPGLEPSVKSTQAVGTITVEESIVQQFQIPTPATQANAADDEVIDLDTVEAAMVAAGLACAGCKNPLDYCTCNGTPTGSCQCPCGCNYKLTDYASNEVICGACEDNCSGDDDPLGESLDPATHTANHLAPAAGIAAHVEPAPEPAQPAEGEDIAGQSLAGAQALTFQAEHGDDVLTPLPAPGEVPVGDGLGTHLVIGGDDFENSQVTVIAYQDAHDPQSQRQILFTQVTPEAEEKIRAALALKATLVEQQVTEEVTGPVYFDADNEIATQMELAARSVNAHLKAGDEIPQHTLERIETLREHINVAKAVDDEAVVAMAQHYAPALEAMEKAAADFPAAVAAWQAEGTRVPKVSAFVTTHEVTKTVKVPGPATSGLPVSEVPNRSIQATLSDGISSWDGQIKGAAGYGSMLRVDLGDGYTAYYRPRESVPGEYSEADRRSAGDLEIIAPAGVDDPTALVSRLGALNLTNDPLTQREAEWAYLRANIFAANLDKNATVKKALAACNNDIEAQVGILTAKHYSEAIGLDEKELQQWANRITVRAQRRSLTKRTERIRAAVAKASGITPEALVASGNYKPVPVMTRVGVTWRRFDVDPATVAATWAKHNRGFSHRLVKDHANILNMLKTGTLSPQSRRRRLGVPNDQGWSEGNDKTFNAVYLRNWENGRVEGNSVGFAWKDPSVLLQRPDWWANNKDEFGKASSKRDPISTVSQTAHGNEFMFTGGIDLYGPEGPSFVNVPKSLIHQARQIVADRGITEVNGIPVDKWLRAV